MNACVGGVKLRCGRGEVLKCGLTFVPDFQRKLARLSTVPRETLQGLVGSLSRRSVDVITIPVGAVVPILLSNYQSILSFDLYTNVKKRYRKQHKDFIDDELNWN